MLASYGAEAMFDQDQSSTSGLVGGCGLQASSKVESATKPAMKVAKFGASLVMR